MIWNFGNCLDAFATINILSSRLSYIVDKFLGAIVYADDLVLLAPTLSSLQSFLSICQGYGIEWCVMITFLNDSPITYVTKYKYLGVWVTAGREVFNFCQETTFNFLHPYIHIYDEMQKRNTALNNCIRRCATGYEHYSLSTHYRSSDTFG